MWSMYVRVSGFGLNVLQIQSCPVSALGSACPEGTHCMIVLREEGHAPPQNSVGSGANGSPASMPLTFGPEALTPGPR